MTFAGRLALIACVALGVTLLSALGFWQVERLHWKEDLIAMVEARRQAAPQPLEAIEVEYARTGDVDYIPVEIRGTFDHRREVHFFTTFEGASGWDIFTPLRLDDGRQILVNRGFVPAALRDPATRPLGNAEGAVTLTGLARDPVAGKPNPFMPDNDVATRSLFWRSLPDMAAAAGIAEEAVLPFYVDAGPAPNPGGWPRGGTTFIAFSNNHLGYAITWFGLAFSLLLVGGAFLFRKQG